LVQVECLRTLDRLRLWTRLSDEVIAQRRATVLGIVEQLEIVDINASVLDRASHPFATELGILDAIHLASALPWRETTGKNLVMATRDEALATAVLSMGLPVAGIS
jgi:hypothetical protein